MGIRRAYREDADRIAELLLAAREESPLYRELPLHEKRTRAMLDVMLGNPRGAVFVDDNFDSIVIGDITPDWLSAGYTAVIHLAYARPEKDGLRALRAFKKWAKSWPQVDKLYISTSFGDRQDTTDRVLKALGFEVLGTQYMGVL